MEIPERSAADFIHVVEGSVLNSNRMRMVLNRAMAWRGTFLLSFLLMCGFIQCQSAGWQQGKYHYDGTLSTADNGQEQTRSAGSYFQDGDQTRRTEPYPRSPPFGTRYHCRASTDNYDCIFQNVFIDNLNYAALFGHAYQWNNESKLTFVNSTIKSLPKSLVDTYANVEVLNLERLQIETIQRNALANGRKIKELHLSYNNIASLDAGVFDNLESLEQLIMDGNHISRLPARLFLYTSNLKVVSMAGNNLDRIEDETFRHTPNLESVIVASNRLIHFDLSLIPSLYDVDVKNNLLQELNMPGRIAFLDASNNQIRSVVTRFRSFVLEALNLSHNKLNTTAWLTPFTKLRSLDLSFNEIEDITSPGFKQMTDLNTLRLNNNRLFTFNMASSPKNSLKILDLSRNNLVYVENSLKSFELLEELYLDHNSIVNVNLETLRKLRNLTLSHNDWDCAKLVNLYGKLPAPTVVDYETETHCKEHFKLERGICCTVSEMPYHDRLIKYIAELTVQERLRREQGRCSEDAPYDLAKNFSDVIASAGTISPTLAKEVQALKSDVQRLQFSTAQANSQVSKGANKIDELLRTYAIPKQGLEQQSENLRSVFNHLAQRDAFKASETVVRQGEKEDKEREIDGLEVAISEMQAALESKKNAKKQAANQIGQKINDIKKLEAKKNKNLAARKNTK